MLDTERSVQTPFTVDVPQEALDDLRERLIRTRFATEAPGDSWDYGTPTSYLKPMVRAWRDFDWRAVESKINSWPQFRTEIEGQPVHFLHVRSNHPDATPLLLTHSYPGSVLDFLDMIGPLTEPEHNGGRAEQAFHVVIPSIPGTGFSTPLVGDPWTLARVARTFDTLMRRLGYSSYGAHGSDWGAQVSRELAVLDPPGFRGAHVLQLFSFPSGDPSEFANLTPDDHAALAFMGWFQRVGGYNTMNGSRPQTIAAALSDSPVGQLAYNELFENFGTGTTLLTQDQVLAQTTLTWLTNTSATMVRYYFEDARAGAEPVVSRGRIGVVVFADDFKSIRSFAERDNQNIVHWSTVDRGGHYASLELPEVLTEDLRTFFADQSS
jgi:pimeloyl-ACP methyl ester carboxylesterase